MNWLPAIDHTPTRPGYYVVRLRLSDRPIVLWWGKYSTDWRDGARLAPVEYFAGPLEW